MKHAVHFSSASDEWRTPPELFAALDKEFSFKLDAAATIGSALCPLYFTKENSALWQSWGNRQSVWLNPPYSRGLQAKFIQKAHEESAKAHGVIVACLIPARPDTAIWHKTIFRCASEIRFLKGRVRFVGAPAGAPFPSAVVIFGQDKRQQIDGWDWKNGVNFSAQ